MKRSTLYASLATAVLLVGLIAWKIAAGNSAADPRRASAPIVKTELPRRESVRYTLKFTGDVLPTQQANIYSKVNGNLERIHVDMGMAVRKGQLLALIDTTELSQQYQQASATSKNAQLVFERTKELAAQNLVAKQDLDNADAAMKVALANEDNARTRLEYARIRAPFAGIITRRYLDPGANVTSNTTTLFTLMDLDAMKVIVSVLEKDIPSVKAGIKASVGVDAFPGRQFNGAITRLSEAVDLSTRTMAVQIDIPNGDHMLKPGMFAAVIIFIAEHKNAVTIPTQAIQKDDKGMFVYVVDGKTARRRDIVTGSEQDSRTEIVQGLSGDEPLVSVGQQFVKDGSPVTIQQ